MAYKKLEVKIPVLKNGNHYITCDYGYYSDGITFHKGIDIVASSVSGKGGDYVVAFADGVVVACCNNISGTNSSTGTKGMGNYVIIDNGNGFRTRYQHLLKGSVKVSVGDKVAKGQVIGYMGNTGNSTGRHLHFDISYNKSLLGGHLSNERYYLDPKPFLQNSKTFLNIANISKSSETNTGEYIVVADVNVRKNPTTISSRIGYENFSNNAKEQIKKICPNKKPDYFPKGMKLTISQVNGTWGKCPSGWVSLKYCKKS